jgi:hypothetical protein
MILMKRAFLTLALAAFAWGAAPFTMSPVEAKTSNQVKNENKGKAAKAASANKKAARAAKKKK